MEWISVKDRLPDTAYSVLVFLKYTGFWKGFYLDKKWYVNSPTIPNECVTQVTHWADIPLPEAYDENR